MRRPRLNQAAHQALVLAGEGELPKVDAEAALEALSLLDLGGGEEGADSEAHPNIQSFMRTG